MLSIKDLCVKYGDTVVVDQASLDVQPGEVVALIGPNGAGKTSLVRAISGVVSIDAGEVQYAGEDVLALSALERARVMAVVPQVSYQGGAFTVDQVVMMGRTAHMSWLGRPSEEDEIQVFKAMRATKTDGLAERRIAELSGGEQQRVMLARALAQDTPLLVLDEPTNHLDLQHQGSLLSLVREQCASRKLAVLMVLHDLNLVALFADRVGLMVGGWIEAFGRPGDVLSEKLIRDAYQVELEVLSHPETGEPIILHQRAGDKNNR
jgi:iron complex transport system ATP-binding protein